MDLSTAFLTLAALFLTGLAADTIGRRTRLPRVTLLLVAGLVFGNAGFDLLPPEAEAWYPFLSVTALTMVAFLLGSALTKSNILSHGKLIFAISIAVVAVTVVMVAAGLSALGAEPALALILAAVATATAPAATLDVINESGVKSPFTETLKGIVAIDDAWGLIVFSVALAAAGFFNGATPGEVVLAGLWELLGAVVLGAAIGLPAAYFTGRITHGDPLRTEALGIVFLTAGVAIWAEVSFLVAGMTAGALVVNYARHHTRAFHEVEHLEWPFMLLFFLLAGASLEPAALVKLGAFGAAFVILRIIARLIGAALGARLSGVTAGEGALYGMALMPQAGVAVGMALVAGESLPDLAEPILTITIASTVAFELLGPLATAWAIRRSALAVEAT